MTNETGTCVPIFVKNCSTGVTTLVNCDRSWSINQLRHELIRAAHSDPDARLLHQGRELIKWRQFRARSETGTANVDLTALKTVTVASAPLLGGTDQDDTFKRVHGANVIEEQGQRDNENADAQPSELDYS